MPTAPTTDLAGLGAPTIDQPPATDPTPAPDKPLGGTVLRGLVWLGGMRWVAQLFTWASTLIIARLLAPEDYGLVALATVLTGFLEVITDLGLGSALVQSRNPSKRDVEATMGATILLGLGAAILVALSAPIWAYIQNDQRIIPIVQALAFGVLLTTAGNVPYSMLHRRLAFGLVARAQFFRGLVTAVFTLGGALILQSHWALVVGYLAGKIAITVVLMWAEPVRPRLPGPDTQVAGLLRFGGVLTADRILNYARSNIDVALVGALLGTRMVGLYVMAIALPACFGLIVTAELLVPTVIGSQWLAIVRPLQVAAIVTPLAFHLGLVSALFNATGRVDLNLRITTLTSVLTIGAVFIGVRFGIVGVAAATGIAFTLVWVYAEVIALRLIGLTATDAARTLLPAASAAAGMAICVYAMSLVLPLTWPPLARLIIECTVGVAAYIGWAFALHRNTVVRQLRSLRTAWVAG